MNNYAGKGGTSMYRHDTECGESVIIDGGTGPDVVTFTLRCTTGEAVLTMTREEALSIGRALVRCGMYRFIPGATKVLDTPNQRPRPEPNLQRNELTEESRRFPYVRRKD